MLSAIAVVSTSPITATVTMISAGRRSAMRTMTARPLATAALAFRPISCNGQMARRSNARDAANPTRKMAKIPSGNCSLIIRERTKTVTTAPTSTTQANNAGSGFG